MGANHPFKVSIALKFALNAHDIYGSPRRNVSRSPAFFQID